MGNIKGPQHFDLQTGLELGLVTALNGDISV